MRWVICTWLFLTTLGLASCSSTGDYASELPVVPSTSNADNDNASESEGDAEPTAASDLRDGFAHDAATLPAGIAYFDGWIVESTANPDASSRRLLNPNDGETWAVSALRPEWLGGDLTKVDDRGAQLTVDVDTPADNAATVVLMFDPASMAEIDRKRFDGTALGICHDGERFYTSDGTANLIKRASDDLAATSILTVLVRGAPLPGLAALTCDPTGEHPLLYAALLDTNRIVAIDPTTGNVERILDVSGAAERLPGSLGALSAIALKTEANTIAVTGPGWDRIITIAL